MKKRLEEIIIVLILIVIFFLVSNVIIVVWNYVDPDGFFQFLWFLSLSITVIFTIGFIVWGIILFFIFIKNSKGFSKTLLGLLIGLGIVLSVLANTAIVSIPSLFVQISLSDKEKYINSTEYLLNRGEFEKAMQKSEKILQKAIADTIPISQIWFLQNLIERSSKGRKKAKINYFNALTNYAYSVANIRNNFEEAEKLFLGAMEYARSEFPDDKQLVTFIYPYLIEIYFIRNDFHKANLAYYSILEYLNENESDNESIESIIETLLLYASFADLYFNTELAFDYKRQAFDIYENSDLKKTNHLYFSLCLNLAHEYLQRHQINIGEVYLSKIQSIAKTFKNDYYSYQSYLIIKSGYESSNKNYAQAEKTHKERLKIIKKRQGKKSFDYADGLALLASHYHKTGDFLKAGEFYDESLDILHSYRTENLDDYINILFFSAITDFFNGRKEVSHNKLLKVRSFLISQMNNAFIFMTMEEKESYIDFLTKRFQTMNTVIFSLNDNRSSEDIYNNVLFFNGVAFQSNQFLKSQLLLNNNKTHLTTYDSIQLKKSHLKLLNKTYEQEHYFELGQLLRVEKILFNELARDSSFLKYNIDEINWKSVQKNLKPNEIAIEIVNIKLEPYEQSNEIYCALLIDVECEEPKKINLCKGNELFEILNIKGTVSERINTIYSGEKLKELTKLIWDPIENEISDASKVYLTVSGLLHQVSFSALTIDKDIEIQMINSTRTLAEKSIEIGNNTNQYSLLYGNINYGHTEDHLSQNSNESNYFQSSSTLAESIQRSNFGSLPFTINEVNRISQLLISNGYEIDTITGSNATKESLIKASISRKPRIIHIATHGFYFNPDQSYLLDDLMPIRSNGQNNPMFRSGLLFAGANNARIGKEADLNGILTSFEIANMDLTSTDLVVLSACETGLGDIKGYEGVFGLQRAFKIAGAKSLIVSLWKVSDEQTSELMQSFYEFYLSGMSKHEALKSAQKKIRENNPEPFYWAAFKIVE
jgi:CHAT domain-containing protein